MTEPRLNGCIHLMKNLGDTVFFDLAPFEFWVDEQGCGLDSETACWGDVDGDLDLDLFLPAYPSWAAAGEGQSLLAQHRALRFARPAPHAGDDRASRLRESAPGQRSAGRRSVLRRRLRRATWISTATGPSTRTARASVSRAWNGCERVARGSCSTTGSTKARPSGTTTWMETSTSSSPTSTGSGSNCGRTGATAPSS